MATKTNRCWPGYEPVPGKREHEQGSCRPKAKSKLKPSEAEFRKKRRKQLDKNEAEHPQTSKSAWQHLHAPGNAANKKQRPAAKKKRQVAKKKPGAQRSHQAAA